MRIVAWNIRAGGGERIARISRYLQLWAPDAVVLSEFRAAPAAAGRHARAEPGDRKEVPVPRLGAGVRQALAPGPRPLPRGHELRTAWPRRGSAGVQRARGGLDRLPRRLRLARRLPPPARRGARLHVVLPQRPERLPDRSGVR